MKQFTLFLSIFAFILGACGSESSRSSAETPADTLLVGTGLADITGPSSGNWMMGYGKVSQMTSGIHTRLWARAFWFESPVTGRRFAYVNLDLGMTSAAIKLETLRRTETDPDLRGLLGHANLMIGATHTHCAPGGYLSEDQYKIPGGFRPRTFEPIVDGILRALRIARGNLAPGSVLVNAGDLEGASRNRSLNAFFANPENLPAHFAPLYSGLKTPEDRTSLLETLARRYESGQGQGRPTTNREMTLLRLRLDRGGDAGMLNWFAVHATSFTNNYRLISSDNKGYAAWAFERAMGVDYRRGGSFVAGFANGDEGDVSPNVFGASARPEDQVIRNEAVRSEAVGDMQFRKAKELFDEATESLGTEIAFRHRWVKIERMPVDGAFTHDGRPARTCLASLGFAFAAGAEDGATSFGLREGMRIDQPLGLGVVAKVAHQAMKAVGVAGDGLDPQCHFPKRILFPSGSKRGERTPRILPFQLARVGSLAIAAIPGEITTTAGARLRSVLLPRLAPIGVTRVVLAGLANSYSGYVTTWEEYQQQQYEGGHTLYGPHTLAAYLQIFSELADQLASDELADEGVPPRFSYVKETERNPKKLAPDLALRTRTWKVLVEPHATYKRGERVRVVFRSAKLIRQDRDGTFLEVQRKGPDGWKAVAFDWDPATTITWRKDWHQLLSRAVIEWDTKVHRPGVYRIVHRGERFASSGRKEEFHGETRAFEILP